MPLFYFWKALEGLTLASPASKMLVAAFLSLSRNLGCAHRHAAGTLRTSFQGRLCRAVDHSVHKLDFAALSATEVSEFPPPPLVLQIE